MGASLLKRTRRERERAFKEDMGGVEKGSVDVAVITQFVTIVWHSEWTLMNSSHGDSRYNLFELQYHLYLEVHNFARGSTSSSIFWYW